MAVFMLSRILFGLLAVIVVGAFGQNSAPIKAGDPAPNLSWDRVLNSAGIAGQNPASLFGHVTVLFFSPNVSANDQLASDWNELVGRFAGQAAQFVCITSEIEKTLTPRLAQHPMKGWLLLDEKGVTARAFGIEPDGAVIVDRNGRIAGFTFWLPAPEQIQAVEDERAIAIKGDADDRQMQEILAGRLVRLDPEPHRFPAVPEPRQKPDLAPSYEVHISASTADGTDESSAPDFWSAKGFDLRSMIAKASETEPNRVILPASLDRDDRYDFVLVPPQQEEQAEMKRLMRQGIEKHFHVSIATEKRLVEVYVMTALKDKTPPPKADGGFGGGFISSSSPWIAVLEGTDPTPEALPKAAVERPKTSGFAEITAPDTTLEIFLQFLEMGMDRPIVDETGMTGSYDFNIRGGTCTTEDFIQRLREQLGLILTPAQRTIEMVVVTPAR